MKKTAVILFNLGGPDELAAVRPFLFNLFHDRAIIGLPQPLRWLVAQLISRRRDKIAQDIYAKIGGRSPILENTQAQAAALEKKLQSLHDGEIKCFVAMRYWRPFTKQTVQDVKNFAPDEIILLPLYPQFSTTTTASSIIEWHKQAQRVELRAPVKTICCYPDIDGFIQSVGVKMREAYGQAQAHGTPRILLSAHGLPEKIIKAGDPYQWQCEQTAAALRKIAGFENADMVLCYQSRVGPLQWITPATDDEVRRAGRDKVPLVVVPIAFVSEHSETLVELDIEYRHLAQNSGVPFYACAPTVGVTPLFVDALAKLVCDTLDAKRSYRSSHGERICPAQFSGCPIKAGS